MDEISKEFAEYARTVPQYREADREHGKYYYDYIVFMGGSSTKNPKIKKRLDNIRAELIQTVNRQSFTNFDKNLANIHQCIGPHAITDPVLRAVIAIWAAMGPIKEAFDMMPDENKANLLNWPQLNDHRKGKLYTKLKLEYLGTRRRYPKKTPKNSDRKTNPENKTNQEKKPKVHPRDGKSYDRYKTFFETKLEPDQEVEMNKLKQELVTKVLTTIIAEEAAAGDDPTRRLKAFRNAMTAIQTCFRKHKIRDPILRAITTLWIMMPHMESATALEDNQTRDILDWPDSEAYNTGELYTTLLYYYVGKPTPEDSWRDTYEIRKHRALLHITKKNKEEDEAWIDHVLHSDVPDMTTRIRNHMLLAEMNSNMADAIKKEKENYLDRPPEEIAALADAMEHKLKIKENETENIPA